MFEMFMIKTANERNYTLYGFKCELLCFEVSSRGVITKNNKSQISKVFKVFNETKVKQHLSKLSQTALVCSYIIYLARNEQD